jgi:hypothetical protein
MRSKWLCIVAVMVLLSLPVYGFGQEPPPGKAETAAGAKTPPDSPPPGLEGLKGQSQKYLQELIQPYLTYFDAKIKEVKRLAGVSEAGGPGKTPETARAQGQPEGEPGKKARPEAAPPPASGAELWAKFMALAEALRDYVKQVASTWLG